METYHKSNSIKASETQLVANLNFGDSLTSEGRLRNYITVTQIGSIAGDTSTGNDQNRDSRDITLTDTGRKATGIF